MYKNTELTPSPADEALSESKRPIQSRSVERVRRADCGPEEQEYICLLGERFARLQVKNKEQCELEDRRQEGCPCRGSCRSQQEYRL